jgi:hypothetical protein
MQEWIAITNVYDCIRGKSNIILGSSISSQGQPAVSTGSSAGADGAELPAGRSELLGKDLEN